MSEPINCHACGKKGAKEKCKHCRCASYCNEQCAMIAWNAHQEDCNVIHVSSPTATAFVPYFGEDQFDERQLEEVDPNGALHQSYIVHYVDPAGSIVQHTVEPILASVAFSQKIAIERSGANPSTIQWGVGGERGIQNIRYNMTITYAEAVGDRKQAYIPNLTFGDTSIYKGAKEERGKLATLPGRKGLTIRDNVVLLLWPGMDLVTKTMRSSGWNISSNGGIMRIALSFTDQNGQQREFSSVEGVLCFGFQTGGKVSVFLRGIKRASPFKTELEIKNRQKRADIPYESIFALRGDDPKDGSGVVLTFQLQRDRGGKAVETIELIDIEYRVPVKPLVSAHLQIINDRKRPDTSVPPPITPEEERQLKGVDVLKDMDDTTEVRNSIPFRVDADNLDHVSGLLMAMEQKMASGEMEGFHEELSMIQEHQQKLEHSKTTGEEYATSPAIQAIVYDMTNQMFIGLRWKAALDMNYYKMHKNDPLEGLQAQTNTLQLPKPGDTKSKIMAWARGKKGKAMGRIRAIEKIINERLVYISDTAERQKYAALLEKLATVLNVQE